VATTLDTAPGGKEMLADGPFILKTKLYIPRQRAQLVSRPQLSERLDAGLDRKLTLISAPAGYGKTTLLASWAGRIASDDPDADPGRRHRIAWLSLDKSDNDPNRFLAHFIAALQGISAGTGEQALSALAVANPPHIEHLIGSLINDIAAIPCPFALVLDDYHLITESQVHEALLFLLENQPAHMHLIVSGRSDPPWPMARLRSRGELSELRIDNLRFSADEIAAFMNGLMGLGLDSADVAALEARTEGWIAGLQMAAISMKGSDDVSGFIRAFTGSNRFVLDYLMEEVLGQQPEPIQEFLLKTSVLERLTAPLCDFVLGERGPGAGEPGTNQSAARSPQSQSMLDQLEAANLFIEALDDQRGWYRYHQLFAELLHGMLEQGKLKQSRPGEAAILRNRASRWFEENGLLTEAVYYALAAGDVQRVEHLVATNALAMIFHGELPTLVRWLNELPPEDVGHSPWLCLARAWTALFTGRIELVESYLDDVESALEGDWEEDISDPATAELAAAQLLEGNVYLIRSYACALGGDLACSAAGARRALDNLPAERLVIRGFAATLYASSLRWLGELATSAVAYDEAVVLNKAAGESNLTVDAYCDLATLLTLQGRLRQADEVVERALALARHSFKRTGRLLPAAGYAYIRKAILMCEWNDLAPAERYALRGYRLCRQWGQADFMVRGGIELARIFQASGDETAALATIRAARRVAHSLSAWYSGRVAACEALIFLAQGNLALAARSAREAESTVDHRFEFKNLAVYFASARVLIAQERIWGSEEKTVALAGEPAELLERLAEACEKSGADGYLVEVFILRALLAAQRGDDFRALEWLGQALSLGEPGGYLRLFVEEGRPMERLLRRAAVRGLAHDYPTRILAAYPAATGEGEADQVAVSIGRPAIGSRFETLPLADPLSKRELEVLRLLPTYLTTSEIADQLCIAPSTVRSHIKHIYSKLQVHGRAEAVQRAEELALF
jgi:LuxR family maltose regulon positive regulatory protein